MWTEIVIAVGILVGLGLSFAVVLAVANKQFWVYEDPRIDAVTDILPGTNCGACGDPDVMLLRKASSKVLHCPENVL